MFGRQMPGKEVFVIFKEINEQTHHFMDVAGTEEVALKSVQMTYPHAEMEEEPIGKYGVSKKLHFSPIRDGNRITIVCMEPNKDSFQLE